MKLFLKVALCTLMIFSVKANNDSKVFEEALQSYEKVHNAFFKDDLKTAKKEAKELAASLSKLEGEKVKKTLAFTQKKLEGLQKETQLREAHKAFNVISQGMLVVLEKQIPVKKYARYYCPMVKKYWIQNTSESEKVLNPYAAKSMPHCGAKMN